MGQSRDVLPFKMRIYVFGSMFFTHASVGCELPCVSNYRVDELVLPKQLSESLFFEVNPIIPYTRLAANNPDLPISWSLLVLNCL